MERFLTGAPMYYAVPLAETRSAETIQATLGGDTVFIVAFWKTKTNISAETLLAHLLHEGWHWLHRETTETSAATAAEACARYQLEEEDDEGTTTCTEETYTYTEMVPVWTQIKAGTCVGLSAIRWPGEEPAEDDGLHCTPAVWGYVMQTVERTGTRTVCVTTPTGAAAAAPAPGPTASSGDQVVPDDAAGRVLHRTAAFPVWVAVADVGGATRAAVHVRWSAAGSKLPFAAGLAKGDVSVLLPGAAGGTCAHRSAAVGYGTGRFEPATPPQGCVSLPARRLSSVRVEHESGPMACVETERQSARGGGDGSARVRVFGCYWAQKPGG